MSVLVLDASVAVKWFLPPTAESLTDEADQLLQLFIRREVDFAVPDVFWAELANVFWKAIRQNRLTKAEAELALVSLTERKLPTVPSVDVIQVAFAIANAFQRSVYDSIYVAVAVQLNAQLITADERLVRALSLRYPVRWLGAI